MSGIHSPVLRMSVTNLARRRARTSDPTSRSDAARACSSPSSSARTTARRKASSAAAVSTSTFETPNESPISALDSACPSSRFARSSVFLSPRLATRSITRRASSTAASSSCAMRSAAARRSWTSSSNVVSRIASASAPSSARPSSRSADRRRSRIGVVAGREEDAPILGRGHDRERRLDHEAEGLVGGVRGERRRGCLDREPRRPGVVAGRERVAREHRQAFGGRLAALEQQVDHGSVDLAPAHGRELVQRELANLLVGERVVGRVVLGMLVEQARIDRRLEDRR